MKGRSLAILISLFLSMSVNALETDNYLTWEVVLSDSGDAVNKFMTGKIQATLDESNAKNRIYSCEAITLRIAKNFMTTPGSQSLEDFVKDSKNNVNIHPKSPDFLEESILSNTRFYLKFSGLSPNLQINGFYFGADKLSHFASTGRRYFKKYIKMKRKGYSEEDATKTAIRYGLLNESTVLGWWASGVFSYGDMEANFQGLEYYKSMCFTGVDNYLAQDDNGKWKLVKTPDIRKYVNAYWDETFNPSFFAKSSWPAVKNTLSKKYCGIKMNQLVQDRMSYYESTKHTSFSLEYIKELQSEDYKNAPIPRQSQNFEDVCEEKALESALAVISE